MTRFEQLAAAFPNHIQRIAECVYEWDPRGYEMWRDGCGCERESAGWTLCDAFDWSRTVEGFHYWQSLAKGEAWMS